MSEPYVGEIRMVGFYAGNNIPPNWAYCDGRFLAVAEYEELYDLIKNTYGGDKSAFALPDLRGRVPLHRSKRYAPGDFGGVEEVTLTLDCIPRHHHRLMISSSEVDKIEPEGNCFGEFSPEDGLKLYRNVKEGEARQAFSPEAVSFSEGEESHTNMQPFQTINFIIALRGLTPTPKFLTEENKDDK